MALSKQTIKLPDGYMRFMWEGESTTMADFFMKERKNIEEHHFYLAGKNPEGKPLKACDLAHSEDVKGDIEEVSTQFHKPSELFARKDLELELGGIDRLSLAIIGSFGDNYYAGKKLLQLFAISSGLEKTNELLDVKTFFNDVVIEIERQLEKDLKGKRSVALRFLAACQKFMEYAQE